ncbi:MAG TPA: type I restriction enzyme HsdR N-terminal domain-containing protein [Flavisolibacter sp.]|nr:type I restriction enzyme HsdR N-terminal domain-containing protein [Flavisolibacter sp.]
MKKEQGVNYIFDGIRKSWLLLTEEEWVRQNIVSYLTEVVHYPASVIALEKEITLHDLKKRFDILIYNRAFQPWMLIECKAPDVPLSEQVLQQVLRYNISVPVQYMLITNGENTIGWKKEGSSLTLLQQMPKYE